MPPAFQARIKSFGTLQQWYNRHPKMMRYACADMLNQFAFNTKKISFDVLGEKLTIRKPSFVSGSVKFTKTKGSIDINKQRSQVGSIYRPDFSGWREQELGIISAKSRTIMLNARRGRIQNVVYGPYRMKAGKNFVSPDDSEFLTFNGEHRRAVMMLHLLAKRGHSEPFIVKGHDTIATGLFKFKGGATKIKGESVKSGRKKKWKMVRRKLVRLQSFKTHPHPYQYKWMYLTKERVKSSVNLDRMWQIALMEQIKYRSGRGLRFR